MKSTWNLHCTPWYPQSTTIFPWRHPVHPTRTLGIVQAAVRILFGKSGISRVMTCGGFRASLTHSWNIYYLFIYSYGIYIYIYVLTIYISIEFQWISSIFTIHIHTCIHAWFNSWDSDFQVAPPHALGWNTFKFGSIQWKCEKKRSFILDMI